MAMLPEPGTSGSGRLEFPGNEFLGSDGNVQLSFLKRLPIDDTEDYVYSRTGDQLADSRLLENPLAILAYLHSRAETDFENLIYDKLK